MAFSPWANSPTSHQLCLHLQEENSHLQWSWLVVDENLNLYETTLYNFNLILAWIYHSKVHMITLLDVDFWLSTTKICSSIFFNLVKTKTSEILMFGMVWPVIKPCCTTSTYRSFMSFHLQVRLVVEHCTWNSMCILYFRKTDRLVGMPVWLWSTSLDPNTELPVALKPQQPNCGLSHLFLGLAGSFTIGVPCFCERVLWCCGFSI